MTIAVLPVVLLIQVLQLPVLGDDRCPGPAPDPGVIVDYCNYYCEGENFGWRKQYYQNGTKCKFQGESHGICAELPSVAGCFHKDDEDVQIFLRDKSTTTARPRKSKRTKRTKKPKGTKKPKTKSKSKKKISPNIATYSEAGCISNYNM
nr:uncharacterized protein LOC126539783 isoform X2 [Dermacentor andersoni]